jgi:hypothetical protein
MALEIAKPTGTRRARWTSRRALCAALALGGPGLGCSGQVMGGADEAPAAGTPTPPRGGDPTGSGGKPGPAGTPAPGTPGREAGPTTPFEARMQRLTAAQYRNVVTDLFGAGLTLPALEEEAAVGGFASLGASEVGTSRRGVALYGEAAQAVARQVMTDPARRKAAVPCAPADPKRADDACAGMVVDATGRRLFRRPLTPEERTRYVALAAEGARSAGDFARGVELALEALLQSPIFLYRAELGEPVAGSSTRRLTGAELASRLSFALHDTAPDDALLTAALKGELETPAGLRKQAERLLAAKRGAETLQAFFAEMFRLPDGATPEKASMRQETLLVLAELEAQKLPYTRLFSAPFTFVDDTLAKRYGLAVRPGSAFTKVTLPEGPRQGLLGHAALLVEGTEESHPIPRGKFIREALLCQEIPPPPPGTNTELPPVTKESPKTARERLAKHREDPSCAGCHALMDPVGLALESFDGLGRLRTTEHGLPIDPSGELDGKPFRDARELGVRLGERDDVRTCLVRSLRRFMTGQMEGAEQAGIVAALDAKFRAGGESVRDLQLTIVTDESFRTVVPARQ